MKKFGYDADAKELHVHFVGGGHYKYHGVPSEDHEAMIDAGSHGRFLNENIKPNYSFTRVA